MKKLFRSITGLFLIAILVYACRKDSPVTLQSNSSGPTLIDPATIFPSKFGLPVLPADNPLTVEGVYLGRLLFYDPVLSLDSTISCSSCHKQEFAFADPGTLSTGIFGLKTTRNAPGLFNLAYHQDFFWDARQKTLHEQVLEPVQAHNEMGMTLPVLQKKLQQIDRYKLWFAKAFGTAPNVLDMAKAIEQFEMTLVSSDSKFNQFFPGKFSVLTDEEKRGALLFENFREVGGADCSHCHGGALCQQLNPNAGGIANNGLDTVFKDKGFGGITGKLPDMGTFKTMSMLNIALTAPYMHDGRFKTLDDVIDHYSDHVLYNSPTLHPIMKKHEPQGQLNLTPQQKSDLKAFLMTMTDNVFINNPAYANPYK